MLNWTALYQHLTEFSNPYLSHCSTIHNIMLYWTALYQRPLNSLTHTSVTAVLYTISCYTGLRYISTPLNSLTHTSVTAVLYQGWVNSFFSIQFQFLYVQFQFQFQFLWDEKWQFQFQFLFTNSNSNSFLSIPFQFLFKTELNPTDNLSWLYKWQISE